MIQTIEELEELEERLSKERGETQKEINVCVGTTCLAIGADEIKKNLKECLAKKAAGHSCKVRQVGCNGLCAQGPLVMVNSTSGQDPEVIYQRVKPEDAERLSAVIAGEAKPETVKDLACETNIPFFTMQKKVVLENAGYINPDSLEDYIAHKGYNALFYALSRLSPEEVIEQVKASGLSGRGGGGYPTGLKWESVAKTISDKKYVICNGDEGDPGAFMDRAVMESDPHRVLEGMALCGYAVGADAGYIYVRAEYPVAVERLKRAIREAERNGLLGSKIAGTQFSFMAEVRLGGGAFVCGEATALIGSIEGNRGNPRQKPPHLSDRGLWAQPTVLNNVETFASVPPIMRNGGEWYAGFGTEGSKGTKVFALSGQVKQTGLVEVPMGITLRELIYDIGGGVENDRAFKAVQTGGPSGGCIPESLLDTPIAYETLKSIGSIMGSGGVIVMDETSSMVEVAKFFLEFCMTESCGKCVPCRVGTAQMYLLIDKFAKNKATEEDLTLLEELCETIKETSLCGLGQTAPNPVLSTLRYFRNEYLAGIKKEAK
ncbi:MAG: NAD(P)H-dependent oxidoreductase subunit E [Helicobacteraceae bacterium]|jgi:bidirectional [NiFe] hydrogenase diaphorase subunit|nr:NAD(P)H-dependent oxidoreductase subunit E [Helicobacteraceae bacterium]